LHFNAPLPAGSRRYDFFPTFHGRDARATGLMQI
jgi:hypothetical protein